MKIYRIFCDECTNEFEIKPIHEPVEDLGPPKVCPFCEAEINDWLHDEDIDEDELGES